MKTIIKINHAENQTPAPDQEKNKINFINVFRKKYSNILRAYFIRSKNGITLIINSAQSAQAQARCISIIEKEIQRCGVTEMGLIKGNWSYRCGGSCCNNGGKKIEKS